MPFVLAMGLPTSGLETAIRNDASIVGRFLDQFHGGHYRIINTCKERTYDYSKFHHQVSLEAELPTYSACLGKGIPVA
jgi:phosphatidylinositol-3,4,5-trisphosphate 3-phosphatase/dual-specificity protein phosphatase PTEN